MSQKVLVTGANGGFGELICAELKNRGHKVIASMRDVNGRNREKKEEFSANGIEVVEIDVTSNQSVNDGVKAAGEIDVLVNNAGTGVLGLIEFFTPEDMQRLFDINVFGVQRMNRAVLPAMRARKSGLLIHISSLLGRITVPFYGIYNASKWALEAMAENYRTELSQFGIESVIVEPGGYPTTFIDALMRPSDNSRKESYGEMGGMAEGFLQGFEQNLASNPQQDPKNVALAVADVIDQAPGERPFRTVVDKLGMGDALQPYNDQLHQITAGIYGNFGIGHLLSVKQG